MKVGEWRACVRACVRVLTCYEDLILLGEGFD